MPPRSRTTGSFAAPQAAARRALVATTVLGVGALPGLGLLPAMAAPAPEVTVSASHVTTGAEVTATVARETKPEGTTLVLQRRFLDRWRTVDPSATRSDDGPTFVVPTGQYGAFSYRVLARAEQQVVARSPRSKVTVKPAYHPIGEAADHRFITDPPTRWDSCSAIRWTFNRRNAPERALRQLKGGFRRVHMATGLKFEYVGRTKQKPNPYGARLNGAEVILGWRTSADYDALTANTVALGGNSYYRGYQEADGRRVNRAVRGGVVFNADYVDRLENGYGDGLTWGDVVIHELGHVLGLAHAPSDKQIMYPAITDRVARYGAGDLAGLRRVGNVRGCLTQVANRAGADMLVRWSDS